MSEDKMTSAEQLAALVAEYGGDPLDPPRGYNAMTPQEATDDINTDYRFENVEAAPAVELYDAIDEAEEGALESGPQAELFRLYQMSAPILIGPNTRARRFLITAFPNGTASYAALMEMFRKPCTRAHELGLPTIMPYWSEQAFKQLGWPIQGSKK